MLKKGGRCSTSVVSAFREIEHLPTYRCGQEQLNLRFGQEAPVGMSSHGI